MKLTDEVIWDINKQNSIYVNDNVIFRLLNNWKRKEYNYQENERFDKEYTSKELLELLELSFLKKEKK